jgi:hypothetical protein
MAVLQQAALEVEQHNPCLGTCCSVAVGRLEIQDDTLQGAHQLLPEPVLTLVVCLVSRQALAPASTMCGIHLTATRAAMKRQLWLVQQLEALPGGLPEDQVEWAAACRKGMTLMADTRERLEEHGEDAALLARWDAMEAPDSFFHSFLGRSGANLPDPANLAVLALHFGGWALPAAAKAIPGAGYSAASWLRARGRYSWMQPRLLPFDPSPMAVQLRRFAVPAADAVAAHTHEEDAAAARRWHAEALEVLCSKLGARVQRQLMRQGVAEQLVRAAAGVVFAAEFATFTGSYKGSREGKMTSANPTRPATLAAVVLVAHPATSAKFSMAAAGAAVGVDCTTLRLALDGDSKGRAKALAWVPAQLRQQWEGERAEAAAKRAAEQEAAAPEGAEEGGSRGAARQRID